MGIMCHASPNYYYFYETSSNFHYVSCHVKSLNKFFFFFLMDKDLEIFIFLGFGFWFLFNMLFLKSTQ